MVILRIWLPSQYNTTGKGASAVTITGLWGSAHCSTRPQMAKTIGQGPTQTASLADDMAGEGPLQPLVWRYRRMDESRMLRLWSTMKAQIHTMHGGSYEPSTSFRTSDLILAAGRGIDIEANPVASFSARARGMAFAKAVATNCYQLQQRADYYMQVAHW
jgi:hypothetical protein